MFTGARGFQRLAGERVYWGRGFGREGDQESSRGAMWRDGVGRAASAARRLALAERLWGWRPHPAQARFFCSPAQMRIAACGRRWGKTEALSLDVATLALEETNCRQLVVAPTDAQARLLGNEVLLRLLEAWEWRDEQGRPHPLVEGREIAVRQRPALSLVLTWPGQASEAQEIGRAHV